VVELDLDGGTLRPVAQAVGQTVRPIGVDDELGLLVYAITPHAAAGNVLAFDLRGGVPRDLGAIGRARSFSLARHLRERPFAQLGPAVVYEGRDAGARVIAALGLDGARALLYRATSALPLDPLVAPSREGDELLTVERDARGVLVPRAATASGLRLYERWRFPRAASDLVVRTPEGGELVVASPLDERWEPVGFGPTR